MKEPKEEKKIKALNLLVKEKKIELRKLLDNCSEYKNWEVLITNKSQTSMEVINQLTSEDQYNRGNIETIDKYNCVLLTAKIFLKKSEARAIIKSKNK